jgi:hypothetical protein
MQHGVAVWTDRDQVLNRLKAKTLVLFTQHRAMMNMNEALPNTTVHPLEIEVA